MNSRDINQLRPYLRPVVWAEVFAGDGSGSGLLDGHTSLNRDRTDAGSPLTDQNWMHADFPCEISGGLVGEVLVEVHGRKISTELINMQQHFAYRGMVSKKLPLPPMNRTEVRQRIRREAFAKIRATKFKTNAALSEALGEGFAPSYVSQLLSGHRGIGDEVATKIEDRLSLPRGWLDQADEKTHPVDALRVTGARKVWVIGNGQGGLPDRIWEDGGYPVGASDKFAEVATDDQHAFVVCVRGDSMIPRYQPGEYALVEPSTAPEIEDDVLVRLASGETMLKRLLSRRAGVRLGSYNTAEVMTYREEDITWIYYVSHPIPARKIKHWVEASEYAGEERRHEAKPHEPERRSGYVLPKPKSEMEHVYGRNLAPGERATPPAHKRRKAQ